MRKGIVSIVGSAAVVAVLSLFACGSSSSGAKGRYGEECSATDDCEDGLMCGVSKVCTLNCGSSDSLCQAKDPKSKCVGGQCANPCNDKIDCPSGLTCVMRFSGNTCGLQ